ncbi:hypothetical protein BB561_004362 [Smittium simulii]|uniref:NDT80 domain-containing protein n=1 Tax=Smittium simulii TaxID=133385 RepID=A0A2T9YGS1_9FUNG|nr:hypothetical protein BB561_004362 [Smittium simulii]
MNNSSSSYQYFPKNNTLPPNSQYRNDNTLSKNQLDNWKSLDLLSNNNISTSEIPPQVYTNYIKTELQEPTDSNMTDVRTIPTQLSKDYIPNYNDINIYKYDQYNDIQNKLNHPESNNNQFSQNLNANYPIISNTSNYQVQAISDNNRPRNDQNSSILSWNTESDLCENSSYRRFSPISYKKRFSQKIESSIIDYKRNSSDPIKISRPRRRKSTDPYFGLTDSAIPFFGATTQLNEIYNEDRSTNYSCKIVAKIDRGFFLSNDEWTCYRRNYFQINTCFRLFNFKGFNQKNEIENTDLPLFIMNSADKSFLKIKRFFISISAFIDNDLAKKIELIMHTSKRDKGPQIFPIPQSIQPGGNLQSTNITNTGLNKNVICFERLQFKTATANNGKRRAAQQYYKLVLNILADCGDGDKIPVASVSSAKLVVRGRSPGHYNDNPTYRTPTDNYKTSIPPRLAVQTQNSSDTINLPQPHDITQKDKLFNKNRKYDFYKQVTDKNSYFSQPEYTSITLPALNTSIDSSNYSYNSNQQASSSLPPFQHNNNLNQNINSFDNTLDPVTKNLPIPQNVNQMISKISTQTTKNGNYLSPSSNHNNSLVNQMCNIDQKPYNIGESKLGQDSRNYGLLESSVQNQGDFNNIQYFLNSNSNIADSQPQIHNIEKNRDDRNLSRIDTQILSAKRRFSQLNTSGYQFDQNDSSAIYNKSSNAYIRSEIHSSNAFEKKFNTNSLPPLSAPEPYQTTMKSLNTEYNQNGAQEFNTSRLNSQSYSANVEEKKENIPLYNYSHLPFYKNDVGQQNSYDNILIERYNNVQNNNIIDMNDQATSSNHLSSYKNHN